MSVLDGVSVLACEVHCTTAGDKIKYMKILEKYRRRRVNILKIHENYMKNTAEGVQDT